MSDLDLYTQRRRHTIRDVIREQHGTPTELREERYGTDPEAERRPPICDVCGLIENRAHEVDVVHPARAADTRLVLDWASEGLRMALRQGKWFDEDLYPDAWISRQVEILEARIKHHAKREGGAA